jgi:hypothetical protein
MAIGLTASRLLMDEAQALLSRLARVRPFALQMTMVGAANIPVSARTAIECMLAQGRQALHGLIRSFLTWLTSRHGRAAGPEEAQRRFSFLRLRFNAVLTQFDIFADVLSQRSEHDFGVWMAGLDALAADALALPGYYAAPPVICYLDRGHGAAIRRVRTRLPGGGDNPVAVIRVPRERMVGSGVASSLIHEVGHQGSSLLDLVESIRPELRLRQAAGGPHAPAWAHYERWISEILADAWSVAKVGITSTMGLVGVVSLPRVFVFQGALDDPHPIPWIRVLLSCAMGRAFYPHPQWIELAGVWKSLYPPDSLDEQTRRLLAALEAVMPAFVEVVVNHRPAKLRGASLGEVLADPAKRPERLLATFERWRAAPQELWSAPPTWVFAVIGQARIDGRIHPQTESKVLAAQLTQAALTKSIRACAPLARPHGFLASKSTVRWIRRLGLRYGQGV